VEVQYRGVEEEAASSLRSEVAEESRVTGATELVQPRFDLVSSLGSHSSKGLYGPALCQVGDCVGSEQRGPMRYSLYTCLMGKYTVKKNLIINLVSKI
jgi:hypothetical protein